MVGKALNADVVLSGSYAGDVSKVALNVELAEVRSGRVIWAQKFRTDTKILLEQDGALRDLAHGLHEAIVDRRRLEAERREHPLSGGRGLRGDIEGGRHSRGLRRVRDLVPTATQTRVDLP